MSSPELQSKPAAAGPAPPVESESSSLVKWLIRAALIVGLMGVVTVLIQMLPTEVPSAADRDVAFPLAIQPTGPPGRVVLTEPTTHNFKIMPQQSKGRHTWVMKNEGRGELELSKGPSTCSCTIANFSNEKKYFTLKPGEQTEITLEWETREFDGKIEKSATINIVNDPDRTEVKFSVEGTVRPALAIEPKSRSIYFGEVPNDQSQKAKIALASADKEDFKLISVTSTSSKEIVPTPTPLNDEDRKGLEWTTMTGGYRVDVELLPSKSLGAFNEEVIIATDHPLVKEVRISVGGKRVGPISMIPETARLHNVSSAEGATTTVMISVRNAPDTVFTVVQKPESLKVEVVPSEVLNGADAKVRRYKLNVTVPPDAPEGVITEPIILKSTHPQVDRISVSVDITVVGK